MLKRLFTEHPASVNETYCEHVAAALGFGIRMFFGAWVCLIHAFLPFLFVKTGSRVITGLYEQMISSRARSVQKGPLPVAVQGCPGARVKVPPRFPIAPDG